MNELKGVLTLQCIICIQYNKISPKTYFIIEARPLFWFSYFNTPDTESGEELQGTYL